MSLTANEPARLLDQKLSIISQGTVEIWSTGNLFSVTNVIPCTVVFPSPYIHPHFSLLRKKRIFSFSALFVILFVILYDHECRLQKLKPTHKIWPSLNFERCFSPSSPIKSLNFYLTLSYNLKLLKQSTSKPSKIQICSKIKSTKYNIWQNRMRSLITTKSVINFKKIQSKI